MVENFKSIASISKVECCLNKHAGEFFLSDSPKIKTIKFVFFPFSPLANNFWCHVSSKFDMLNNLAMTNLVCCLFVPQTERVKPLITP